MYIIVIPRRVASFFERFFTFTHTILYRYHLIYRCHPVPIRFSGPELVAPHLESTLDEQLQSWFARPISRATSVPCFTGESSVSEIEPETFSSLLVTTPRRWTVPFGPTVLGGFRITRSQKNT